MERKTRNPLPPERDLLAKNHYELKLLQDKSKTWFDQQVLLLSKKRITPNQLLANQTHALTTKILPGNLYLYFYDPKLKNELPYFDRFPMVFPWRANKDGFIGLNLHYLPYALRAKLITNLLAFRNNNKMDESTRLKFSWQMIDGISKYRLAKPCVKQYLYDHVKSPFVRIDANEWGTAMMLPVERFQKSTAANVWQDSIKKAR